MLHDLPSVDRQADYTMLRREEDPWHPVVRAICRRHDITAEGAQRLGEGSNVVFALGPMQILKLFPPHWSHLAEAEAATADWVFGKLGVDTPRILHRGSVDGWRYIIMTRVHGTSLRAVWATMAPDAQQTIAAELGQLLARQHALPVSGVGPLRSNWPELIEAWTEGCVERRRSQGLSRDWLAQIPSFLERAAPLYPPHFTPVIVTGDMHQYHLTVEQAEDGWHLAGYYDFDDAIIGFREYDLAVPGVFMMAARPELYRTFLLAYGYSPSMVNDALRRRLMAYTLLLRYRDLNWLLAEFVRDPRVTTLEELSEWFFTPR